MCSACLYREAHDTRAFVAIVRRLHWHYDGQFADVSLDGHYLASGPVSQLRAALYRRGGLLDAVASQEG